LPITERSIVTMALYYVVSEIFTVEKYRDLEMPVKGQSRSLKMIPYFSWKSHNFPTPCILRPRWRGLPWNWYRRSGLKKT